MTYNEVFTCRNLLLNVPLEAEGRILNGQTAASVLLLRVAYGRKADQFISTMQGVRAELEKEHGKDKASEDETFRQAQEKHAAEEAGEPGHLTRSELAEIISLVGVTGTMPFLIPGEDKPRDILRADFLTLLARYVCETI